MTDSSTTAWNSLKVKANVSDFGDCRGFEDPTLGFVKCENDIFEWTPTGYPVVSEKKHVKLLPFFYPSSTEIGENHNSKTKRHSTHISRNLSTWKTIGWRGTSATLMATLLTGSELMEDSS